MHKFFRYPNFSETLKGCPRNFSALWDQKFSTENRVTPPPSLSNPKIFFYTRKILKHRRDPLRSFSVLWEKKIFDKTIMPPPLLYMKIFDTRTFLKHRRVLLRSFLVLWEKRFSIENRNIPSSCKKKSISDISGYTELFPTKFFGTVRQKILNE